jgi:predicted outer membrane repeat protein
MKNEQLYIPSGMAHTLPSFLMPWMQNLRLLAITAIIAIIGTPLRANEPAKISPSNLYEVSATVIPTMRWVLLPGGTSGTCVSNTDCCTNTYCYGLEYTPGSTGDLTSYTTAFFVDCVNNGSPVVSNATCVMTNASVVVNGCVEFGLIQMQCSGNSGTLDVVSGVPVILHQVCFTVPAGVTLNVIEDETTDLTTSIDLTGGGAVTEFPAFVSQTLVHDNIVTNTNNINAGSLRHVIDCALSGSTITFSPSLVNQTITLTSGVITINKNLTIQGLGIGSLTLSGNNASNIFHVLPGNNLIIKDIALKNATAVTNGGAIYAQGNAKLQNVLLQNNFENGIPKSLTISPSSFLEFISIVNLKQ